MTTENAPEIVIYTHPDCSFSAAAKMEYRRSKTAYTEIDLAKQPDQIPALLELTNGERITRSSSRTAPLPLGIRAAIETSSERAVGLPSENPITRSGSP